MNPVSSKFSRYFSLYLSVLILANRRIAFTLNNRNASLLPEVSPPKLGADVEDDLSDPFKFMPPGEKLRAAQKEHQKLQFAIQEERKFTVKLSGILDKELFRQNCSLKRTPALGLDCAHIVS